MFHCRNIHESDWPTILRIQSEVYYAFTPESEVVMRSKATCGPRTSFVAVDQQLAVVAYCLAHPYLPNQVAVLGSADLSDVEPTDNLYLHDLSVRKVSSGCGVAQKMFDHLITIAQSSGYRKMSLVAVQQAAGLWTRMGFTPANNVTINDSYNGEATFLTCRL